jgi:hypothetical protein
MTLIPRDSQRAYRERKVQRIVELEGEIDRLVRTVSGLEINNQQLELELCKVKTENDVIRSSLVATQHSSPASIGGYDFQATSEPRKAILLRDCLTMYGGWYDGGTN